MSGRGRQRGRVEPSSSLSRHGCLARMHCTPARRPMARAWWQAERDWPSGIGYLKRSTWVGACAAGHCWARHWLGVMRASGIRTLTKDCGRNGA
jgi:hypothetical protein